jgi:hypothetical protein
MTAPAPCACWSCDGLCGGSADPGWCGPTEANVDGHPVCEACRSKADVIGADRTAAAVTLNQDRVCLAADTFSVFPVRCWLTAASARELARVLTARAEELEATA